MKTISVSEIIRAAQMGDTLYVLATEAEAEIAKIAEQRDGYYDEAKKAFAERDKAVELLSLRYTNLNQDGKTILDFQNVWIEQARDRNIKLEAEIAALRERQRVLSKELNYSESVVNHMLKESGRQIERQRVLVDALELVMGRSDRLKSALRTIKTDKSFGPNAVRLLQSIASLSLLEEAKQTNIDHACRAALAAKEG